jgi:hypothetical protein
MGRQIKIIYSELIWELYSYYMDATNSDRDGDYPVYEEFGDRINDVLNGGKKTFYVSVDTAKEISSQATHCGHPHSYNCMRPSTKRGYRSIANKIDNQLKSLP